MTNVVTKRSSAELVPALDELLVPQAHFCSGGVERGPTGRKKDPEGGR